MEMVNLNFDLNTSHVNVNPLGKAGALATGKFKYISC